MVFKGNQIFLGYAIGCPLENLGRARYVRLANVCGEEAYVIPASYIVTGVLPSERPRVYHSTSTSSRLPYFP